MADWKKVDLTTYPFFLKDEIGTGGLIRDAQAIAGAGLIRQSTIKDRIVMDLFSLGLGGKGLEYFDSETDSPPPIPDELKIYCPVEEQNTEFWPSNIGNTEEYPDDWARWFYLDYFEPYESVSAYRNSRLGDGWYTVEWEALSPIIIRPIKEGK